MGAWEVKGPAEERMQVVARRVSGACRKVARSGRRSGVPSGGKAPKFGLIAIGLAMFRVSCCQCCAGPIAKHPFSIGGQRMTWRDGVGAQVDVVAARLRHDFSFKKGDRLCLLMAGCPEYVISYLAIISSAVSRCRSISGSLRTGWRRRSTQGRSQRDSSSRRTYGTHQARSARASLESVQAVFATGRQKSPARNAMFGVLTAAKPTCREAMVEWDLCAISFTSGTTGVHPRARWPSHQCARLCSERCDRSQGLDESDVNLCMRHVSQHRRLRGLPARAASGEMRDHGGLRAARRYQAHRAERATWAVAAPIMLWMMIDHRVSKP